MKNTTTNTNPNTTIITIMTEKSPTIVLFGSAQRESGSDAYEFAFELGQKLAKKGFIIANGGYGGIMQASAHGAHLAGGQTIGVTCTAFKRGSANPWIDKEISTDNLNERLNHLVALGDAYIALPGGTGTLLELALVWESINKRFLPQRPIICIAPYWRSIINAIISGGEVCDELIDFAETTENVMQLLCTYFKME